MAITNKMAHASKERDCFGVTAERKYYRTDGSFVKRSLRPSEWQVSPFKGTIHVPRLGIERLLNEAAALKYVRDKTNIPVPTVHACFEDDKAAYLVTSYIEGVTMNSLTDDQRATVTEELEGYIKTLHSLRSSTLGGPSGHVILPYRLLSKTFRDEWDLEQAASADYGFCHNDLSKQNVIVDPTTLKIAAIIDWEYAGFFPVDFDAPFYRRLGPSVAINDEEDDTERLLEFVNSQRVSLVKASLQMVELTQQKTS